MHHSLQRILQIEISYWMLPSLARGTEITLKTRQALYSGRSKKKGSESGISSNKKKKSDTLSLK